MITLEILGHPSPQGSKRGMLNRHTGQVVVIEGGSNTGRERLKTWRQDIIDACHDYMSNHPYDPPLPLAGPLNVIVTYRLPRPKSAPKKRLWPTVKPDLVKIHRSTEDAMKLAGLYDDEDRKSVV